MSNYPTYDPGTKILIQYDSLCYGKQNPSKITTDKNGIKWIEAKVITTWQPFFFPGYDVRLPNGTKVPITADRTKPCPN
jgi:hypothetical protein